MDGFGQVSFVGAEGGSLQDWAAKLQRDFVVLFVDCCNCFDPYLLCRASRSEESLERVKIARPFTLYQLRELVVNKLERMVQESGARVVLVSGIGYYGLDEPLCREEASAVWGDVFERLRSLSRDYNLLTLVSGGGVPDGSDGEDRVDADS